MATIADSTGQTEIINARRTESLDAPAIKDLIFEKTERLFGIVDVIHLIEKALLAVTLTGENDDIVAHAAFYDYPNIRSVDQAEWEGWMQEFYDCSKVNPLNCLFMHHFVSKPGYEASAAREIIRTVYNAAPQIHYVFLFVKETSNPDPSLIHLFEQLSIKKECNFGYTGYVCYRHNFFPVLYIRPASVEDNDDLTPIFNEQSEVLRNTYGDFFVAELVESQNEHMKCLAAEVEGRAIGFMSVCDHVNLNILNSSFELGAFHGLKKQSELDILEPPPPIEREFTQIVLELEHPSAEKIEHAPPMEQVDEQAEDDNKLHTEMEVDLLSDGKESEALHPDPRASAASSRTKAKSKSKRESRKDKGKKKDKDRKASSQKSPTEVEKAPPSQEEEKESPSPTVKPKLSDSAQVPLSHGSSTNEPNEPNWASSTEPVQTRVMPMQPPMSPRDKFRPTFVGECNAVVIQLFAIDEKYEMRSIDFLPKVFELFPDKDFVVITLPHLVPEFPLLQNFVRVTPKPNSTLSHELYVFNKGGLISNFRVRKAKRSDNEGVENLIKILATKPDTIGLLEQFHLARRDPDGTEIQAFVAECLDQIVGIAIIRQEENIEYVRSHFNIEDFIYFDHHRREEHAHVYHLVMNPIFLHLSKSFIKEMMRLGHKTCLYYPIYPDYAPEELQKQHSLISTLSQFVPVRARRQIVYPKKELGVNAPSDRVLREEFPFALYHINRKLIMEPKVAINARIVVVGASTTGLSFLEMIVFCPHLKFNNITLVSPHGIPGDNYIDELVEKMLGTDHCYSMKDYIQASLRTFVNVVYGRMTAIDRKKKILTVDGTYHVPFDHIILTTGLQFQYPCPTEADIKTLPTSKEVPNRPDRRFKGTPPDNLFIINDHQDAAYTLHIFEARFLPLEGNIIVYGNCVEAFSCIQALLDLGFSGSRIILIKPAYIDDKNDPRQFRENIVFNNTDIEGAISDALAAAQVVVKSGFLLAQWNDGEQEIKTITDAAFTSDSKPYKVDCCAFISFFNRSVDFDSFKAINNACLVFDSRLVIDSNFHTNDAAIRGAGTMTKFQRIYYADQWTHARFNSKVVGEELAQAMLRLFDPTMEPAKFPLREELKLIPMYDGPKVVGAYLPGGYHYLHMGKPSLDMPLNTQMVQSDYGRHFITGSPESDIGYFRIHINQYNNVETITCLSKKPFPHTNFMWLYGIHEKILNNMADRFSEGLIKNFYEYFNESWVLSVYHDRFNDFRDEIRELLLTRPSEDQMALEEKVRMFIDEDPVLSKMQRESLFNEYISSGAKRAVETRLLNFISYNYYHLPMYAKPGMV